MQECDQVNEFYYDTVTKELFYVTGSGTEPPAGVFEAPQLKTLFEIRGTQADPVRNVSFQGLTFTGAAYTYLDVRCSVKRRLESKSQPNDTRPPPPHVPHTVHHRLLP